jgi:hypothetical protein
MEEQIIETINIMTVTDFIQKANEVSANSKQFNIFTTLVSLEKEINVELSEDYVIGFDLLWAIAIVQRSVKENKLLKFRLNKPIQNGVLNIRQRFKTVIYDL